MANTEHTRGGSHEQHVKSGEQSHKNSGGASRGSHKSGEEKDGKMGGTQGGTHEQHVKAGQQSHKNS
jgi:hypothetical protein